MKKLREIKFRCWDKKCKQEDLQMFSWEEMKDTQMNDFFSNHNKRYKLMQYTGLKDKNGMEVYEGDIVREQRKRFKDKHFVAKWNNGIGSYTFKPVDKSATSWPCFNIGTVENLEVVGNIYENPELLKETNKLRNEDF